MTYPNVSPEFLYDIIAIHMLTNDVRNFSPETCVDKHAEGSDTLSVDKNIDIFIKVQNFIRILSITSSQENAVYLWVIQSNKKLFVLMFLA
jgi:hypothetical protein